MVDLKPHSSSYLRWQGFDLTAENRRAVYIPKGFAHGFKTLAEHCEIAYQISTFYVPEAAGGYRYDDAAFRIVWPLPPHHDQRARPYLAEIHDRCASLIAR